MEVFKLKLIDELSSIEGTRILAIGCAPGGCYERPDSFRLAARA